MNALDLRFFAAVARSGGIGRAAQMLNTVQSNVTTRLRSLEAELGTPLFHRHSRGVVLTEAGERLLPYAEKVGQLLSEAKRAALDGEEPGGELRIGAMETTAALRLPPILAAYVADCPKVDVHVETGPTQALVARVLARELEGAFVCGPIDHPDLHALPMMAEELVLVTPPAPLERQGGEGKILVFRAGCSYRQRLEALLAAQGAVQVRRMEFGTLDGILGCVGAGLGVTLLPRAVAEPAARTGKVRLQALPPDEAHVTTAFITRHDAFMSRALDRFIAIAQGLGAGERQAA
ncbi:LysR family transcriptional regulator [Aquabacter sediminis]|uniref:LysR family transcriptional regulator n=1 Tax=Aquabacter sediminis TaxID=3029197 RepID=UPI00237D539F|nr:LysR family transcriptional regulator [Aquabacter sp. P-9]MDE1569905.1 LysR substrate-binding domain-containing protein [Aquabacter sp. P-9]